MQEQEGREGTDSVMSLRKALVLNIPWDFLRGDVFEEKLEF